MANKRIDQLTGTSTMAAADLFVIYDIDGFGNEKSKKMTYADFHTLISGTVGGGGGGGDLVDDTSPQLGGDLDTNGSDIIVATADQLFIPNGTFDDPAIALSTDPNTGIVGGTLAIISVVQGAWQFAVSLNEVKTSATTRYISGNSGTAAVPAYSFTNQGTLGMYYGGSANLMFSTDSTARLEIESDGTLNVAGTTDYEDLVLADDDIPNKKFVDDAIASVSGGGSSNKIEQLDTKVEATDTGSDGLIVGVVDNVEVLDLTDNAQRIGVSTDTNMIVNQSTNSIYFDQGGNNAAIIDKHGITSYGFISMYPPALGDPEYAPSEGRSHIWLSDGVDKGSAGDIMVAVTEGGVTKWDTLVSFASMANTGW